MCDDFVSAVLMFLSGTVIEREGLARKVAKLCESRGRYQEPSTLRLVIAAVQRGTMTAKKKKKNTLRA